MYRSSLTKQNPKDQGVVMIIKLVENNGERWFFILEDQPQIFAEYDLLCPTEWRDHWNPNFSYPDVKSTLPTLPTFTKSSQKLYEKSPI